MLDLFGNNVDESQVRHVTIYADEIQEVKNIVTGETWIYTAAIYERKDRPILKDLINRRYRKDLTDWENYKVQNDTDIHWSKTKNDHNKKHVISRWLEYIFEDCSIENRNFYFSVCGINLSNLNAEEFGEEQNFNNIYNRFFRSMLKYSLKKFFGTGVVVDNIFHEDGQQSDHKYFDWHTVFKLDQDEGLNFACDSIKFLPKSHKKEEKSNIIQLCDVLLGIFKDIHIGVEQKTYHKNKKGILESRFVQELLVNRVIRAPKNKNSRFGYVNRFHVSLFPKVKSNAGSIFRSMNNYYDISKIELGYEHNPIQEKLFE